MGCTQNLAGSASCTPTCKRQQHTPEAAAFMKHSEGTYQHSGGCATVDSWAVRWVQCCLSVTPWAAARLVRQQSAHTWPAP